MTDEVLELETRRRIYAAVGRDPGSSARDVQRVLGLGWGETSYHLDRLVDAQLLRRERSPNRDFYFVRDVTWEDRRSLVFFRRRTSREILLSLYGRPDLTSYEIAEQLHLGKSTVAFHLTRLLEAGLIESRRLDAFRRYRIVNPDHVRRLLQMYSDSFREEVVGRFAEVWGSLFPAETKSPAGSGRGPVAPPAEPPSEPPSRARPP